MSILRHAIAVGAVVFAASAPATAQLRRTTTIPDASTLPAGTCRVWIDGVPADRQPAPTDCETARRNRPRDSRIIYGAQRPTNVYGNRDPRSIPGTGQYDPRYDPRSPQYDPRLDPHDNGRSARERDGWSRKDEREREKRARKHEKEHAKAERKHDREHDKEWKKERKGNGRDRDRDDDDRDDDDRGRRDDNRDGRIGTRGTTQVCVDANRDGLCDNGRSSSQTLPRTIPQTDPQGTTRRVCVDANRDGKCDDGGPLVRVTP